MVKTVLDRNDILNVSFEGNRTKIFIVDDITYYISTPSERDMYNKIDIVSNDMSVTIFPPLMTTVCPIELKTMMDSIASGKSNLYLESNMSDCYVYYKDNHLIIGVECDSECDDNVYAFDIKLPKCIGYIYISMMYNWINSKLVIE